MDNLILRVSELQLIEKSKAEQIKLTFEPMVKMLEKFEDNYNEIVNEAEKGITQEITKKAKRVRLDIGKVRIETEKLRKAQKEEYLRAGKAIDGVANILKWAVSDKENKLKEIENYFEIQEQKRVEQLQNKRVKLLSEYIDDAGERDLSSMDDDVWEAYLNSKKQAYIDKIEAEKKAEEERIAKEKAIEEERQRIKKENEKLKAEAEERERLIKIEAQKRAKIEMEREIKEEAERKKREEEAERKQIEFESQLKAEREEKERIEREERKKRDKLEVELKAKEEAEAKRLAEIEAKKQIEFQKGDAEKMHDLITCLIDLKIKYSFKSLSYIKKYNDIKRLIDKILEHIK